MNGSAPAGGPRAACGHTGDRAGASGRFFGVRPTAARLLLVAGLVLLAPFALVACTACDEEPAATGSSQSQSQSQSTGQTPVAEQTTPVGVANPLPVGQAVAAVAAPAIAEVLGEPVLTRAPESQGLVVTLVYQAPAPATKGDGQRLHDALLARGASPDPERPGVDSHGDAEEFMLLYDTGDPDFKTIRFTVTPGSPDIYVNADKAM